MDEFLYKLKEINDSYGKILENKVIFHVPNMYKYLKKIFQFHDFSEVTYLEYCYAMEYSKID